MTILGFGRRMPELFMQPNPRQEELFTLFRYVMRIIEFFLRRALSEIRSRISVTNVTSLATEFMLRFTHSNTPLRQLHFAQRLSPGR